MKSTYTFFTGIPFVIFLTSACDQHIPVTDPRPTANEDSIFVVEHKYQSTSIPVFFQNLVENHVQDFMRIEKDEFNTTCGQHKITSGDSVNIRNYFTIKILHDLLTSQTAWNGSTGEILNIPYMWHWVTPNPRHEIRLTENNQLLKEIKPPKEFGKYQTYADIDRTPFLYLSEMFSEEPKYYSEKSDTFSTFGWCSEREMAFVCLMQSMGYEGKVVAQGNHSWSELRVTMKCESGEEKFVVMVDNTFNGIGWTKLDETEVAEWKTTHGDSPMAKWYNEKAHSPTEKSRLKSFVAPVAAMEGIEGRVVNYLRVEMGYLE